MNRFTQFQLEDKKLTPIGGYWAYQLVSIEETLQSLIPENNELKLSVKFAKKHCLYPSDHELSRDESAALFLYTMDTGEHSFYRILNQVLRNEDRNQVKSWFSYLKLFDTALHKLPKVTENVWRAVPGNIASKYKTGQILTWWCVTSCSTSAAVVKAFLKLDQEATLFMIEAVNGRNLAGYTMYPGEKEIILGIGTQLRVKNIGFEHGNLHVVHLEEVEDDDTTDDKDNQTELSAAVAEVCVKPKVPESYKETTSSKAIFC
jgi:hypothetical protein